MTQRHLTRTSAAVVMVTLAAIAAFGWTQDRQPDQAQGQGQDQAMFGELIGALKSSKGCLGIEIAQTMSGKNVIFAWFEDKKAVKTWYYSDVHQDLMDQFFPDRTGVKPLADVPDDVGPIMAIASITNSTKSQFEETTLPISQISIELYTPLTGGLYLGGKFAPKGLKVKGMVDHGAGATGGSKVGAGGN